MMSARPLTHTLRARALRTPRNAQGFSTRSQLRAADHGDHYDPPTGWLFGVKPGQKYQKEGWETMWYYGFIGSLLAAGVAYDNHFALLNGCVGISILYFFLLNRTDIMIGYKRGLWRKPDEGWKRRVFWKTLTRSRNRLYRSGGCLVRSVEDFVIS
ncbi:hypothetical protein N8T08_005048 [Aspergillus melleus]|uniref:Uncharacterized protein n=1 Tax=Aspergillus melleus TaxID=138277 RepID=A0ACC3BF77_9EURO|nr:hypothetical protein N8T08_005048 [Aspergillus melleus]